MTLKIILEDIPVMSGGLRLIQSARKDVWTALISNSYNIQHVRLTWPDITERVVFPEDKQAHSLLNMMCSQSESKAIETWRGIQNTRNKTRTKSPLFLFFSGKNDLQVIAIASSLSAMFIFSELTFDLVRFCEIWCLNVHEWNLLVCCLCSVAVLHTL